MQLATDTVAADKLEPLLAPNPQRFVLFPIKHHQVWEMYKKHEVPRPPRAPFPAPCPRPAAAADARLARSLRVSCCPVPDAPPCALVCVHSCAAAVQGREGADGRGPELGR